MGVYGNRAKSKIALTTLNQDRRLARRTFLGISICVTIGITNLFGCAFMPFCADGRMFDKDLVPRIVEHATTRQEIMELFGQPLETNSRKHASASFWRYRYVYLGVLNVQRADLQVYFEGGTVSRFQFTENESRY
jgi:hypothetical protein